ncbi:FAD-dependent monooxygenase [Nonomuraea sp. NPDC049695]|uniref:FAD-dependent monooxygenase n=1 Tax=Nonomuraea sp. NPDC049695 TaxID=3154734 RepID=UPI0034196873
MTDHETFACVVGAGPAGLVTALGPARAGVPFVLLDENHGPVADSRAVTVRARLAERGHSVLSGHRVSGVDGYTINGKDAEGRPFTMRARHVVGADSLHSTVREASARRRSHWPDGCRRSGGGRP